MHTMVQCRQGAGRVLRPGCSCARCSLSCFVCRGAPPQTIEYSDLMTDSPNRPRRSQAHKDQTCLRRRLTYGDRDTGKWRGHRPTTRLCKCHVPSSTQNDLAAYPGCTTALYPLRTYQCTEEWRNGMSEVDSRSFPLDDGRPTLSSCPVHLPAPNQRALWPCLRWVWVSGPLRISTTPLFAGCIPVGHQLSGNSRISMCAS